MDSFSNPDQKWLKTETYVCLKVCRKREIRNHQPIIKPIILKREEVHLLKSANYYQKQNFEMISNLFKKLQRNKLEDLWNLTEIEIIERYGNFSNSANMDMP